MKSPLRIPWSVCLLPLLLYLPLMGGRAPCQASDFKRGDANGTGEVDLSDAVYTLIHLFLEETPIPCEDAADANDDGVLDVTDSVRVLSFLFIEAPPPPPPYPQCGQDPTDDGLACAEYPACGTRVIRDAGGASVAIPPGALDEWVEITVTTDPNGAGVGSPVPVNGAADFGPDGLQFNVPVTVTIPARKPLEPGARFPLLMWDAENELWEGTGFTATASDDGLTYSAEVTHFTTLSGGPGDGGLFGDFEDKFRDCEANGGDIGGLLSGYVSSFLASYPTGRRMVGTDGNCYEVVGWTVDFTYFSICAGAGDQIQRHLGAWHGDKDLEFRLRTPAVPGNPDSFDLQVMVALDCVEPVLISSAYPLRLKLEETSEIRVYGCDCGPEQMWPDGSKSVGFVVDEGPGELDPEHDVLGTDLPRARSTYTATDFGEVQVSVYVYYACTDLDEPKPITDEVTFEVYGKGRIEYQHRLTISAMGCAQTETVSGSVPVSIVKSAVLGGGDVTSTGSGQCDECSTTISGSAIVTVDGSVAGDGSRQVHFDLSESWSKTITTVCPDGQATTTVPTAVTQPLDMVWENGYTIEQPFTAPGASGTYRWTLQIEE